jgi:hypothetical protein
MALAGAVALAGCGGEDKPSQEEFAANAERVCADVEKQSDALSKVQPKNAGEIVDFAERARRTAEDAVKRIRELEVPDGEDGEKAQQWQDAVEQEAEEQLIPALDDLVRAAQDGDDKAILEAAQRIQGIEARNSDRLAREIGAEGCAD